MRNLRKRFDIFCFKNRNKGIPNLMLYITLGNAIVFLFTLFSQNSALYSWLLFDKHAIMNGEVWRLLTWVLTDTYGSEPFMAMIGMYFFYQLGRHIELSVGTLKFNLIYFSGVLLMAVFAMIFAPGSLVDVSMFVYWRMAYYLHLSLLLVYCITNPDAQFLVLFILPVKAWFMSLVYLLLVVYEIYTYSMAGLFPHSLFPLIGLLNFLIYAGKDVLNLLPPAIRPIPKHKRRKNADPIQFRPAPNAAPKKEHFNHKCAVCGRTDVTNPELEFRYCSRCQGYHCYCQDHISNHTHVEE